MSHFPGAKEAILEIQKGLVPGESIMQAFGERQSMGTTATGEDIWLGTATTIPTPPAVGEEMYAVSTSQADNGTTDTGVRTLRYHYIDPADGLEKTEDLVLNGTTPVLLAVEPRFINDMYSISPVGSNGVAEGNITIYKTGDPTAIYNMIMAGGNKSIVPHRMVPTGFKLHLKGWHAGETKAKRVNMRIRSTDMYGELQVGVFCFKDVAYINNSNTGPLVVLATVPALSIVKVSGWPDIAGAETSAGWWGVLVADTPPA